MRDLLFWIPKVLIVVGLIGMLYAGYKRDQIQRVLLVYKWCELEIAKHGEPGGAACRAINASSEKNPKPVLDFYASHRHWGNEYWGDEL